MELGKKRTVGIKERSTDWKESRLWLEYVVVSFRFSEMGRLEVLRVTLLPWEWLVEVEW